ncbi:post-transcriptional regulator [Bacillus sp. H-16]|uniref:post-transcriptional regulator n=1 Tax=Alteribacter salitolerans TaxID=2912333 RepID=UPI0019643F5E|nr:post-transcriptional regulator [Alteribacter salitolerans]MBM7097821.1 post-transcriptional regulator [Alteribacter salitolerans]
MSNNFDEWKGELMPALESKAEEWQFLGYEKVTVEDVWQCVTVKWQKDIKRGDLEEPFRVHRLIGDVFSLKSSEYMNFLTIEAYKAPNYFEKEAEGAFSLDDFNVEDFSKK